jgi:hypothetical protein
MLGTTIDAAHERVDRIRGEKRNAQRLFSLLEKLYKTIEASEEMDDSPLWNGVAGVLQDVTTQVGHEISDLIGLEADWLDHLEELETMQRAEDAKEEAALEREFNLDRYASVREV